jgi:hypothetical protein
MPLGAHFAITEQEAAQLGSFDNDDDRINFVKEGVEEVWDVQYLVETDKAWDGIHRCLGEFPPDTPWFYPVDPKHGAHARAEDHGSYPLRLCVLGGKKILDDEGNYIIRLIAPNEVVDIAAALEPIDKKEMRERYFKHCKGAWPEYGEEDSEYIWEYFNEVRDFFKRQAGNGRTIIFTADQ